jgi:hypothetical protein
MHAYMLTVGAVALAAILYGLAKLGAWVIHRREQAGIKAIRDATFVYQSSAELRALEIDASKRGDLSGAAAYADQADARHAVEMLDQQEMSEGWS